MEKALLELIRAIYHLILILPSKPKINQNKGKAEMKYLKSPAKQKSVWQ
jgi:hypothetical protein